MTKSKLTKPQVEHIAKLANLTLSSQEISQFQKQLSKILAYVELLNTIAVSQVEPTSQVTGLENVSRKDKITPSLSLKDALSGRKKKENSYFKIKSIFKYHHHLTLV